MLRRGVVGILIRPLFPQMVKVGLKKHIVNKGSIVCNYRHLVHGYKNVKKAGINNQVCKYHAEKKHSIKFLKCGELTIDNVGDHIELHGKISLTKGGRKIILNDKSGLVKLILSQNNASKWKGILKSGSFVKVTGVVEQTRESKRDIEPSEVSFSILVDNIISISPFFKDQRSKERLNLELSPKEVARCSSSSMHYFFQRSHNCAALKEEMIGENVTLCGWVHSKNGNNFFTLEDGYGSVLVNYAVEDENLISGADYIEVNDLVFLKGVINPKSEVLNNIDKNGCTVQVSAKEMKVLKDLSVESFGTYCLTEDNTDNHASKIKRKNFDSVIIRDGNKERSEFTEVEKNTVCDFNRYTLRSHNCGEINESLLGKTVHLMGWALYIRMNKFIVLRDKYGTIQLIVPDSKQDIQKLLESLLPESVISVTGTVSSRPRGLENKFMKSGVYEVCVEDLQIINKSSTLPFYSKSPNPSRPVLFKYRYLDLRHNLTVQKSLQMRCDILHKMRKFLVENLGFLEVETPTLFRRTPGGAQEFIVPTRNKGEFYSLVQSPQQFKQLLMIGGVDRYFQIARCYRDETGQRDRQPEFTQLDIEMSFCNREGVLTLIEDLIKRIWPQNGYRLVTPFPRLTYEEAMKTYGSDKPDTRFGCKLRDVTDVFRDAETKFRRNLDVLNMSDFAAHAFIVRNGMDYYNNINCFASEREKETNMHLFAVKCASFESVHGELSQIFSKPVAKNLGDRIKFQLGDVIVLGLGSKMEVLKALGDVRRAACNDFGCDDINVIEKNGFHFLWILDFPLFELVDGQMKSVHHPFTQPHPEDVHLLHAEPLKVRSLHYDLVLNGSEIGGGSIRIHDAASQKEVLENILKLDVSSLKHLLEALDSGAPIHGGFALGIDRFIAHLCRLENINDVIAFPKSSTGRDSMSGAPCGISDKDKALYHIQ